MAEENALFLAADSSSTFYNSKGGVCCLCATAVVGSLIGALMVAIGVCVLLNYSMFDTSDLPDTFMYYKSSPLVGFTVFCFGLFCLVVAATIGTLMLIVGDNHHDDGFQYTRFSNRRLENVASSLD